MSTLTTQVGEKVIVRTYSAGVFFGLLAEKEKDEVILHNARRLRKWFAAGGVDLQGVAVNGIVPEKSEISCPVEKQWLLAIEIISVSEKCIKTIEEAKNVEPK